MGVFKTTYIDKDASPEDVVSIFGALLHNLNEIMNRLTSDNIKSITTDRTVVKSEDGTTSIDSSQIVMLDGNGKKRMILGYNPKSKSFDFSLFNSNGTETLKLSDNGNAVFSGDIEGSRITGSTITGTEIDVDKDAVIGNNLYLGKNDEEAGFKRIQFYDDETNDLKKARIEARKDEKGYVTLKLIGDTITISTFDGVKDGYGNRFVTTNFKPYIKIDDVKYEVKWEGIE